ncbi:MAG: DUF3095 domain-containing protein [Hyphomicrobiaceae bacterium]
MIATDELAELAPQIPEIAEFAEVADSARYVSVPNGWLVGTSDVVDSTGAIARGQYKSVNMVGAGVIAAVRNALGSTEVPFVFGGDGASFVVPGSARDTVAEALAATCVWAREETGLELRAALVPVAEIHKAGLDLQIAKFAVNPALSYTMFSGGGIAWAEDQMKSGNYILPAAEPGARPDLTSLSCRWQPIRPLRGVIASLLVLRRKDAPQQDYQQLVFDIVSFIREREIAEGRPVSFDTTKFGLSFAAISLETRSVEPTKSFLLRIIRMTVFHVFVWFLFVTGRSAGGFDPVRYRNETVLNTDYRKFDDGLKLTIDCSQQTLDGLRGMLDAARGRGIADYGIHAQATALMTCIVPSHLANDHMHFVDGAGGGYAKAAEMLKAQRAEDKIETGT